MGEQVANNKGFHCNVELHVNQQGEYYPVTNCPEKWSLIRGEYKPFGNTLQYPKKWGRKKGAQHLLESKIEDQKRIIEDATKELEMLTACLDKVNEWPVE